MFGCTTDAIGFEVILAAQHQRFAAQRSTNNNPAGWTLRINRTSIAIPRRLAVKHDRPKRFTSTSRCMSFSTFGQG